MATEAGRQHFQAMARTLSATTRHIMPHEDWWYMVIRIGNELATVSEHFDHNKWREACNTEYRDRDGYDDNI